MSFRHASASAFAILVAAGMAACGQKAPAAPSCTFKVAAQQAAFGPGGGTGTAAVTTQSGCTWSAVSQADWIQVPSDRRTGNGDISFTVLPSAQSQSRTGALTIAGESLSVSQETCHVRVTPGEVAFASAGGSTTIAIDAGAGCSWKVEDAPAWATFDPSQGSGSATVTVKAAAQTETVARNATITILSQQLLVRQGPAQACTYSLSVEPSNLSPAAGTVSLRIATAAGCAWTMGTAESWLRFVDPPTGNGPATVRMAADANLDAPGRQAHVQAVNAAVVVAQAGQRSCEYRVGPVLTFLGSRGGRGTVAITTPDGCAWTASAGASWIHFAQGPGRGSAQIAFSADPNPPDPGGNGGVIDFRKAPVEFRWLAPTAGENAWLWQFGDCHTGLFPGPDSVDTVSFDAGGGRLHLNVLVESAFNCPWTVEPPSDSWFTLGVGSMNPATGSMISPGYGRGDGDLTIVASANPSSQPRTAVIVVGERALTITQAGRQ